MKQQWEYCTECMFNESSVGTFEASLDALGKEGWELVSVVGNASDCTQFHAFLKRPRTLGYHDVEEYYPDDPQEEG